MATAALVASPAPSALPGPYGRPPSPHGLRPGRPTVDLVRDQVRALLMASPTFHQLPPDEQRALAYGMVKVGSYAAELVRDDWYQSQKLGQRPLVAHTAARSRRRRRRRGRGDDQSTTRYAAGGGGGGSGRSDGTTTRMTVARAVASAQAEENRAGAGFTPGAAQKIGQVTRDTLNAIAFPTFVAELIRGTFNAITDASIKQMEAYGRLLGDVGHTVDDFMNNNINDNQARDWLVQQYPSYLRIEKSEPSAAPKPRPGRPQRPRRTSKSSAPQEVEATLAPVEGADAKALPNWPKDLGVSGKGSLDASWLEEKLVPAARRKLAQTRLQTLSTLVLMGMNRITVTGGKLRATMAFHIDTSDIAKEEHASDVDFRTAASGSGGFGPWSASASVSFAYVKSDRSAAQSEMNVGADLTSEVEIHFKSDPFPLERMAGPAAIGTIVANTPVPSANTPTASSGEPIPWGKEVERAKVPERKPDFKYTPAGSGIAKAPEMVGPAAQPKAPERPPEEEKKDPEKPEPEKTDAQTPDAEKTDPSKAGDPAADATKPGADATKQDAPVEQPTDGGGTS